MANARQAQKEGKENVAEAQVTPGIEPNPDEVSTAPNTGTQEEQKEGKENVDEAKAAKAGRLKDADRKSEPEKPFDINAYNRQISATLRGNRKEIDPRTLKEQIQKLKIENARLKQQIAEISSQKG